MKLGGEPTATGGGGGDSGGGGGMLRRDSHAGASRRSLDLEAAAGGGAGTASHDGQRDDVPASPNDEQPLMQRQQEASSVAVAKAADARARIKGAFAAQAAAEAERRRRGLARDGAAVALTGAAFDALLAEAEDEECGRPELLAAALERLAVCCGETHKLHTYTRLFCACEDPQGRFWVDSSTIVSLFHLPLRHNPGGGAVQADAEAAPRGLDHGPRIRAQHQGDEADSTPRRFTEAKLALT